MFVFYDLETCFMRRGHGRSSVRMLQIGAISLCGRRFRCNVRPSNCFDDDSVWSFLESSGVRLNASRRIANHIGWSSTNACSEYSSLCQFSQFLRACKCRFLVAHNGRSFDDKILLGAYSRNPPLKFCRSIKFIDTLHDVFRPLWQRKKNNLQVLHDDFFGRSDTRWHTALADSIELYRLWCRGCFDICEFSYESLVN